MVLNRTFHTRDDRNLSFVKVCILFSRTLETGLKGKFVNEAFHGEKNDNTRGFPTYSRIRNRLRMFPAEKFYLIFSDLIFRALLDANVLTSASKIPLFSLCFKEV